MSKIRTIEGLEAIGMALFGENWKSPLSRAVDIDRETIARWMRRHTPLPPTHGVWDDLAKILRRHAQELDRRARSMAELAERIDHEKN